jgi:hypothetical protein
VPRIITILLFEFVGYFFPVSFEIFLKGCQAGEKTRDLLVQVSLFIIHPQRLNRF